MSQAMKAGNDIDVGDPVFQGRDGKAYSHPNLTVGLASASGVAFTNEVPQETDIGRTVERLLEGGTIIKGVLVRDKDSWSIRSEYCTSSYSLFCINWRFAE